MKWTTTDQGVLKTRRAEQDGYKFRVIAGYIASEDQWAYHVAVTPPDGREVNLPTKGKKAASMEAAFAAAEGIAESHFRILAAQRLSALGGATPDMPAIPRCRDGAGQ